MCNPYEDVLFQPEGQHPTPFTIGDVEFYKAAGRSLTRNAMRAIESLVLDLSAHSQDHSRHSERVADYGADAAQSAGLPEEAVWGLRQAYRLHDIGKVDVPTELLHDSDRQPTPEMMRIFNSHVESGDRIIAAQNDLPEIFRALAREVIMGHHEHYRGGQGYPLGLAGKSIPASARLAAVADVLDAVAHRGIYQPAIGIADTLREMQNPDNVRMQNKLDPAMVRLVVNALQPQQAKRPHLLPEIRPLGSRLDTARV